MFDEYGMEYGFDNPDMMGPYEYGMMEPYNPGMMGPDTFPVGIQGAFDPYSINDCFGSSYKGPRDNPYFNLDYGTMTKLGFNDFELNTLQNMVDVLGYASAQKLSQPPFCVPSQIVVKRIMYAYEICMGKKVIDTDDPVSISKHLKKLITMSGGHPVFNCFLINRKKPINVIQRVALVAGIPEGSFYVLNSKNYEKTEQTYRVDKIAQEWVTIYSTRRMAVTHKDRLNKSYDNREWGIPDILKVEEVGNADKGKPWKIKIHKKYCRLCNRFMVMITTRIIPSNLEHHGGFNLVLADGTTVNVYVKTTDVDAYGNPKDTVPNTTKDTVMYDYGFYDFQIPGKIKGAIQVISKIQPIVYCKEIDGATRFIQPSKYTGLENLREIEAEKAREEADDNID